MVCYVVLRCAMVFSAMLQSFVLCRGMLPCVVCRGVVISITVVNLSNVVRRFVL